MQDPVSGAPETAVLTPREIDARHARQLVERSLSQLERGERAPAVLSSKQAIHLAPQSSHAHSLAGLLALLSGDLKGAVEAYEKAVVNFEEGSTERDRLIALRLAETNQSPLNIAALVPNLPAEIVRMRQAVQAAPLNEFINQSLDAEQAPIRTITEDQAADFLEPQAAAGPFEIQASGGSAAATVRPKRSVLTWPLVGAAAVLAGIISFMVVRTLRGGATEMPPLNNTPTTQVSNSAPSDAESSGVASSDGTANTATPDTDTPVVVPVVTPAPGSPTAATPGTRATVPQTPVRSQPGRTTSTTLPRPAAPRAPSGSTATTPTPVPRLRPAPPEPTYPPMPRPRLETPQASEPEPEFPRVAP